MNSITSFAANAIAQLARPVVSVLMALSQIVLIGKGFELPKRHISTAGPVNIMVPGFGGYGENTGASRAVNYFGAVTGMDLCAELEQRGYESYQCSPGPMSSLWDRACEIYAELEGATVDYGEAHSKQHGHARFGKTYEKPLFEGWGAGRPINLIGHSFGGTTARMLAKLLDEGSAAERRATPKTQRSPLFNGGMISRVHSITSLSTPHNGTLVDLTVPAEFDEDRYLWIFKLLNRMGENKYINGVYDLQLDHFGMSIRPGTEDDRETNEEAARHFLQSLDHSFYELTIEGAEEFNKTDKARASVYYFSYQTVVTRKVPFSDKHMPRLRELSDPVLFAVGAQIGLDSGKTMRAPDPSWHENDGMVPLVSAYYPAGQPHVNADFSARSFEPGVWNVMPTIKNADHAYFAGGDLMRQSKKGKVELLGVYLNLMEMMEGTY